jgi:hypothetical protein
LIDTRMFVALVVMAVVTSTIAGPSMQLMLGQEIRLFSRSAP